MYKTNNRKLKEVPTLISIIAIVMLVMLSTSQVATAKEAGPDPQAHHENPPPPCRTKLISKNHVDSGIPNIIVSHAEEKYWMPSV